MQQEHAKSTSLETEIRDIDRELTALRDQSKLVEGDLLRKLHELTDKYKAVQADREHLSAKLKESTARALELHTVNRDSTTYIKAIEKENQFLRMEVERTKYSKDKEGYSRFISGLVKRPATASTNNENSRSIENGASRATSTRRLLED